MIVQREHVTPKMRFDRMADAILKAVKEDELLQPVRVKYTLNPYYKSWEGGYSMTAHEYYIDDKLAFRFYWNYTNGGTKRWPDTNKLNGANGCSRSWTESFIAQAAVFYIQAAAKVFTKREGVRRAIRIGILRDYHNRATDTTTTAEEYGEEWMSCKYSPIANCCHD